MIQRRTAIFLSLKMSPLDVCFLQECHLKDKKDVSVFSAGWEMGPSFWGVGNVNADGVGILFYSWDFVIESAIVIIPGRVMVVDVKWRGIAFRFVNVYAPSKLGDREGFLESLNAILYTNRLLVLGGDFNVSLDNASGSALAQLVTSFSLCDSFRGAGGRVPTSTWQNSRQEAARLDYLFLPSYVKVFNYTQVPMWCSDHCLVGVWVDVGGERRGRGVWRFNTSFLEDKVFCIALFNLVAGWKNLQGLFQSRGEWWEGFKERVAFFCRNWGREKARNKREKVGKWSEELQALWTGGALGTAEGWSRARCLQDAMKDHYCEEAKSFLQGSSVRKRLYDEKPTSFFFATVRGRQRKSYIEGLRGEGGVQTSVKGMLEVAEGFYKDLFSDRTPSVTAYGKVLEGLEGVLEDKERKALEGPLTLQEVSSAVASLKKGTAPGCDGLPAAFYEVVFPWVGRELVGVYQECFRRGELVETMRTGLVTLLYKKGTKEELGNWRPITLLTTDYKVLAKVLTERLKKVIGAVVQSDQTCGVPGRSVSMNLALVRDIISWAEQRQLPLAILSLDQEKAFDRVSHSFLEATLRRMGFGPVFRAWVRLLYRKVFSRIGINGHFTGKVEQLGGVRQGCPLSPLLYVLSLEPLLGALRAAPSLSGVHLPGGGGVCAKVAAYADDTTLFVTSERDFEVVGRILEEFCQLSGARVNVGKSSVMFFGQWAERAEARGGFSICVDGLKILGVRFFRGDSAKENWEARLKVVRGKIVRWNSRGLSLWGRLEVVKADLLPSLNYLAYVFPVPFWFGRKLEKLVFSFLWKNSTEMVARGQMYRLMRDGGRGVPCIPLKMEAIFCSWAARLASQEREHKARFLAQFWLAFPLRSLGNWRGTMPWSANRPEHYRRAADFIARKPWCLEQSLVLEQRKLYHKLSEELVDRVEKVVLPYKVSWIRLQPSYLTGFCKDLNWLAALGRLPVRERLYRHGSGRSPMCPTGCGKEETIEHALWSCPGAASLWRSVMQWWERWRGPIITRDLVLYGLGLEVFDAERRRVIWGTISEGKHVLWEWRTMCLRKQIPRLEPERLFSQLLGKMSAEVKGFKMCFGEEVTRRVWRGLQKVGVG